MTAKLTIVSVVWDPFRNDAALPRSRVGKGHAQSQLVQEAIEQLKISSEFLLKIEMRTADNYSY